MQAVGVTSWTALAPLAFAPLLTARGAASAAAAALATTLVIGLPTAVIENPLFTRMTPVRPLDVAFLMLTSALAALLAASYAAPVAGAVPGRATAGGFLAFLAIGCPVCNKVVVALLGTGGALTFFEPLQPLLGAASVALLATALLVRLRACAACALPARATG